MGNEHKPGLMDGYRYFSRKVSMNWEKNGGKICTIAGTTGLFLTGIHACRKTYKIHDKLAENGRKIREARELKKEGESRLSRFLRITKETVKYTAKSSVDYIPDMVGGALSAYATGKGWHKEHQHYKQAAAFVGVLAADFMNYRQNVIDEHGVEADRRYLTTKKENRKIAETTLEDGSKQTAKESGTDAEEGLVVEMSPNLLRIKYSKECTPQVWSSAHVIRMNQLERIRNKLDGYLLYGGGYTVNDVRDQFFGRKGCRPEGNLYGRIWDPGNPEHPERGAKVNLHYEEDEDFMSGLKDWCWIVIDIDDQPQIEIVNEMKRKHPEDFFTGVEE